VPMMVIFTNFLKGQHNDDFYSRCTSSLIVVCNEEAADKIIPSNQECEFAYKIPVFGKNKLFVGKQHLVVFFNLLLLFTYTTCVKL
jgi:hypothetical protein